MYGAQMRSIQIAIYRRYTAGLYVSARIGSSSEGLLIEISQFILADLHRCFEGATAGPLLTGDYIHKVVVVCTYIHACDKIKGTCSSCPYLAMKPLAAAGRVVSRPRAQHGAQLRSPSLSTVAEKGC